MPRYIEARAKRGTDELVEGLAQVLQKAMAERGAHTALSFPSTAYYLPIVLGMTGKAIEKIGDLEFVLQQARGLLHDEAAGTVGMAALLAAEALAALDSLDGRIDDPQTRTWGNQLADGRIPGVALLVGCAKNNAVAVKLVQELRRHNILCLLGGNVNGRSIIKQLREEGMELGNKTSVIPLGTEPGSAVHALGFVARLAMKLGGHKPGMWPAILRHSQRRTPGFVLALGELADSDWAVALAARDFGFSLIMDTAVSDTEELVSVPFDTLAGSDDAQKASHLIEKCIAARGLKLKLYSVNLPVAYSPAFEDEVICDADLHVQFGGQGRCAFELLRTAAIDEVSDGNVDVIGPDLPELGTQALVDLGLLVKMAGKKLQTDFEPFLERQIHSFLNYAGGVQHTGREDAISIRISKAAAAKGLTLESFGRILHTRFHEEFPAVERVEITVITEPKRHAEWQAKAREVHDLRNKRIASLTDSQVDEFYVCTRCRSFAPNNVSIISPERVSPCGQCNWLDAKASFELNPSGVRRPIKLGRPIDVKKGIWEGMNKYAKAASHGRVNEVALYSIMQSPMCACGDFECIVMLIPEANGVMVVSQEDTSPTPAGITVATFAGIAAGEQIPGVAGIGKSHLLSPKFIAAEGGFRRVVWMSSVLKESMAAEFKRVCEREGDPDLMDKIADEHSATSVDELVNWLRVHKHPAMQMEPMF
jgi:acetyl-CoA synthase